MLIYILFNICQYLILSLCDLREIKFMFVRSFALTSILIDMDTSVSYSNNVIDRNTLKFLELFQQMV